jgi:RNA polymerase sigma-70 factor (ECF subfamily)
MQKADTTDERALISRAQSGETEAFRILVERSSVNMYRLAYDLMGNKFDAEDVVQEAYIKAYRSLHQFRGDAKWSSWLYRITVNLCYDHHKSKSRKMIEYRGELQEDETMETSNAMPTNFSPYDSLEASVIREHIEQALQKLSTRERAVFVLRHYHDLPIKQIAGTLGISEGTTKSLLFRSIQKLQQQLSFYRTEPCME